MSIGVLVWRVLRFERGTQPRKRIRPPRGDAGGVPPVDGSIRAGGGSPRPEGAPARRRGTRSDAAGGDHDRELFIAAVWLGGNGFS